MRDIDDLTRIKHYTTSSPLYLSPTGLYFLLADEVSCENKNVILQLPSSFFRSSKFPSTISSPSGQMRNRMVKMPRRHEAGKGEITVTLDPISDGIEKPLVMLPSDDFNS